MNREIDSGYLEHLRSCISISNDPEYLASYIEEGGEITNAMRGLLAKLIRDRAPKPRGKASPLTDRSFYQQVETWRTSQENAPIYKHLNENDLSLQEKLRAFSEIPKNSRPSPEEAFRHFETKLHYEDIKDTEDEHIDDIEGIDDDTPVDVSTLRKRYERGRKLDKNRI